ncbi:DUF5672 family protein [Arundinibacter roseus]|uniref:DUF5672 domain-containing protein n=1 Tax=Arundinibacter roseus TaxID=2070510 RepID=A0A4R4KPY9_9BACT|nr:DUF5672 family protein [Arundinibacter roseus]TDB68962.1 hypothetical protein EZE20_01080 [Arundinibacter roseus]
MSSLPVPSVAVLIPIYQNHFSEVEKAALKQCFRTLDTYPIYFVKPQSLDIKILLSEFPMARTQAFADDYFTGTDSYNKLMISPGFYQQFDAFDYLLICQPDAYVFRDELPYWCAQGYDYLGAPTLHQEEFDALPAHQHQDFARALATHRLVFNGGLSLRRVKGILRYLRIYNTLFPAWIGNEDMLFSREATRLRLLKPFIKLPSWEVALRFSFEKSPAASFELTQHSLPFGCHAYERYAPDFWHPFIPSLS